MLFSRAPLRRHRGPSLPVPARRRARERGSEAFQFAAIATALFTLLIGAFQVALWFIASMQASAAAQAGAQVARTQYGTVGAGVDAAGSSLAAIGVARTPAITGSRTATEASITVTVTAPSLLPRILALPPITATAYGPVERVTTP